MKSSTVEEIAPADLEELIDSLRRQLAQQERRYRLLDNQVHVLERERQKLAALVHQSDVGFVAFDAEGSVAWTNGQFVRSFGHDCHPAAFHRAPCHRTLCMRETACEGCPVARAFGGGRIEHHELELILDGQVRTVYLSAVPIKAMSGEIAEIMVMVQDLTNLRLLRGPRTAPPGDRSGP